MEITTLVWNLFIVMVPGVIATLFLRSISTSKRYTSFDFTIYSALMGVSSYILLEVIYSIISLSKGESWNLGHNLSIWNNLFDATNTISDSSEMIYSYFLAIPLGVLIGVIVKKGWILCLFRKMHITNRFGDEDIWTCYLRSSEWVCLRDLEAGILYDGKITAYSDYQEKREILLEDVYVYKDCIDKGVAETRKLYHLEKIYIELDNMKYSIETRKSEENVEKAN